MSVRAYARPGSVVLKTIPGMNPPPPPMTTLWNRYGPDCGVCAFRVDGLNWATRIAAIATTRTGPPKLRNEIDNRVLLDIDLLLIEADFRETHIVLSSEKEPFSSGHEFCKFSQRMPAFPLYGNDL